MIEAERIEAAVGLVKERLSRVVTSRELDMVLSGRYKSPTVFDVRDVQRLSEEILASLVPQIEDFHHHHDFDWIVPVEIPGSNQESSLKAKASRSLWQMGRDKGWY